LIILFISTHFNFNYFNQQPKLDQANECLKFVWMNDLNRLMNAGKFSSDRLKPIGQAIF